MYLMLARAMFEVSLRHVFPTESAHVVPHSLQPEEAHELPPMISRVCPGWTHLVAFLALLIAEIHIDVGLNLLLLQQLLRLIQALQCVGIPANTSSSGNQDSLTRGPIDHLLLLQRRPYFVLKMRNAWIVHSNQDGVAQAWSSR
jgi:hypothetical protein